MLFACWRLLWRTFILNLRGISFLARPHFGNELESTVFARYDPAFYGKKRGKDYEKILLRRSCKVLVHETGHMFGLMHCIYFKCVLNGSNHLQESDSRPVHLCPVCLRKLQHSIGFDVVNRYSELFRFYKKVGFDDETQWIADRLEWIVGREAAQAIIEEKGKK